ncbi:hypothetical protein OPIT5_22180 [Opitutaceae bacterium TAV5]|nr:hypothetical protein OPIT5_22180 [Opitutaceae bacterium TAV5]
MKSSEPATLTLVVPERERRVYAKARAILVKKMKAQAPELGELILHELRMREPRGIAESYLDDLPWLCGLRQAAPCRSDEGKKNRRPTAALPSGHRMAA